MLMTLISSDTNKRGPAAAPAAAARSDIDTDSDTDPTTSPPYLLLPHPIAAPHT